MLILAWLELSSYFSEFAGPVLKYFVVFVNNVFEMTPLHDTTNNGIEQANESCLLLARLLPCNNLPNYIFDATHRDKVQPGMAGVEQLPFWLCFRGTPL